MTNYGECIEADDRSRQIITYLAHSIETHVLDRCDEIADAVFGDEVTDDDRANVRRMFEAGARTARAQITAEREADMALATDRVETDDARAGRQTAVDELIDCARSYRETLSGIYGPQILARYGMANPVPTSQDLLFDYVRNVSTQFKARPLTERPRVRAAAKIKTAEVALELDELLARCEYMGEETLRETREDEKALAHRDAVRNKAWKTYQAIATFAEAALRIVEQPELANRVRVTRNRRRGEPEPIDLVFDQTGVEPADVPMPEEPAEV